jgi:putative Mg2+ transporter-C (MgtC) family protein
LGSALFIVISEYVIAQYGYEIDPLRVASNVVTGIGFLGAGMIIFREIMLRILLQLLVYGWQRPLVQR